MGARNLNRCSAKSILRKHAGNRRLGCQLDENEIILSKVFDARLSDTKTHTRDMDRHYANAP